MKILIAIGAFSALVAAQLSATLQTSSSGTWRVTVAQTCTIDDARRVMGGVDPFLTASGGMVTEWDMYAVARSESTILRHRADLLDAREKAFADFKTVLACLNAKEHGR